ncbi:uncharacterized protein LOC112093762 [Morus notabilis]|uniref:uncharacterized protein LOC112093762 n=1 Tax=Morus notabilis TaxID=981085 RepID=UPI000CECE874|nr:uncharacterized protein LOC112093762 [Morus notabilis]
MEDYDFSLQYHPGKANVVADALSKKTTGTLASLALEDWKRTEVVSEYNLQFYEDYNQAMVYNLGSTPDIVQQVDEVRALHTISYDVFSEDSVRIIPGAHREATRSAIVYHPSGQYRYGTVEALYGRPCRSPICWLEPEDRLSTRPEVIQENNEKIAVIQERLLTAQGRQKSYANRRRTTDRAMSRSGGLSYDTTYEEAPVQILDRKIKNLRYREILLVKVLWQHHGVEEATWELETAMQEQYPHLFVL